jgi:hypothetical protein
VSKMTRKKLTKPAVQAGLIFKRIEYLRTPSTEMFNSFTLLVCRLFKDTTENDIYCNSKIFNPYLKYFPHKNHCNNTVPDISVLNITNGRQVH